MVDDVRVVQTLSDASAMQDQSENITVSQGEIQKQGFLWKESKVLKHWRRRWIVLTREHLCSFKKPEDKEGSVYRNPTESIRLRDCVSVQRADVSGTEHGFSVITLDRTFFFSASSEREKQDWMNAIMNFCLPVLRGLRRPHSLQNFVIEEKEREDESFQIPRAHSEEMVKDGRTYPLFFNKALGFLESFGRDDSPRKHKSGEEGNAKTDLSWRGTLMKVACKTEHGSVTSSMDSGSTQAPSLAPCSSHTLGKTTEAAYSSTGSVTSSMDSGSTQAPSLAPCSSHTLGKTTEAAYSSTGCAAQRSTDPDQISQKDHKKHAEENADPNIGAGPSATLCQTQKRMDDEARKIAESVCSHLLDLATERRRVLVARRQQTSTVF
jgi:hypothetical protein